MDLFTLSAGFIINTFVKNKEVKNVTDEFVTNSVKWIRNWFKVGGNQNLIAKLDKAPEDPGIKEELVKVMQKMKDDDQFNSQLAKWAREYQKPNPTFKNVLEDAEVEVEGDVRIGDKSGSGSQKVDNKNIVKRSKIKAGGDFILGDDEHTKPS